MKLFGYLLFGSGCILTLYLVSYFIEPKESTLGHHATDPDLFLDNSRVYAMDHAYDRSLMHLEEAIHSIEEIEQDLDPESKRTVDEAVLNLNTIYSELVNDSLSIDDMNNAFVRVLNALSYAELKVSEHFFESNEREKAEVALKYGRVHLKNALKYSRGDVREYEVHLYEEIDSLIENKSDGELISYLENILKELDSIAH